MKLDSEREGVSRSGSSHDTLSEPTSLQVEKMKLSVEPFAAPQQVGATVSTLPRTGKRPQRSVLTAEQIAQWRDRGVCVIHPREPYVQEAEASGWLLTTSEAQRYRTAARTAVLGNGQDIGPLPDLKNFGGIGFPFLARRSEPLNDLALHSRLVQCVRELLNIGMDDVPLLSQAECWVKRDSPAALGSPQDYVNTDQRMHCDYPNHYLTHPPPWSAPEAVAMIVYLDESSVCGGSTAYVPRENDEDAAYSFPYTDMPGVGDIPWINDRRSAENYLAQKFPETHDFRQWLYSREQLVNYTTGTVLLYRLDLWHRGTPLLPNQDRAVLNLLYKKREATNITAWHRGWATNAYNSWSQPRIHPPTIGSFEELLSILSPEQRSVLGFPRIDDKYWTPSTVRAVAKRYPRMDMTPYTQTLGARL